jgi:glyoxylase-like metal-dependent hydrolase (beta-lactamase superfamily II)
MTTRLSEVADRVWTTVQTQRFVASSNAVIVDLGGELLVVDSQSGPRRAAGVLRLVDKIGLPVRAVVNTHSHWDHWFGNQAYRERWPNARILASRAALDQQRLEGGRRVVRARERDAHAEIARLDRDIALEAGGDRASTLGRWRAEVKANLRELAALRPLPADVGIESRLDLAGNLRVAQIVFLGRAHTDGDLFVLLPDCDVATTGDAVNGWMPYLADAYPFEWVATLDRLRSFNVRVVLPGHGSLGDGHWLAFFHAYLAELGQAVLAAKQRGLNLRATQHEVALALEERFREPFAQRGGDLRPWDPLVLSNVQCVYRAVEPAS